MKLNKLGFGILFITIALGAAVVKHGDISGYSYGSECVLVVKKTVAKVRHKLSKKRVGEIVAWNKAHPNWHPKKTKKETLKAYDLVCPPVEYLTSDYSQGIVTKPLKLFWDFTDTQPVDLIPVDEEQNLIPLIDLPEQNLPGVDVPFYSSIGYLIYYPIFPGGGNSWNPPNVPIAQTSEPASLVLFGTGLLFAFCLLGKKRV